MNIPGFPGLPGLPGLLPPTSMLPGGLGLGSPPVSGANSILSQLALGGHPGAAAFNPLGLSLRGAPGSLSGQGPMMDFLAVARGNTTCQICFKVFACNSALEIHYRSHTKERPFKCTVCDRGFSTKGNMNQHALTHKNQTINSSPSRSNSNPNSDCDNFLKGNMKQHAMTHKNQTINSSPSRSNSNPNSDCDQPKTPNPMRPPSTLNDGGSSDNSRPESMSFNNLKRSPPESDADTLPIAKRLQGATEVSNLSLRPDDPSPTMSAELRIPASVARPVLQMPPLPLLPPVNIA